MKYVVTADNFFGADGSHVAAGTEFETDAALPADWQGKVSAVAEKPKDAKPITNPKAKG